MQDDSPKPLISSTVASSRYNVTNDYVTLLCRQKKVAGSLVGRMWYVEQESLQKFLAQSKLEREEQRKRLSEQLKQEYKKTAPAKVSSDKVMQAVPDEQKSGASFAPSEARTPRTFESQAPQKSISLGEIFKRQMVVSPVLATALGVVLLGAGVAQALMGPGAAIFAHVVPVHIATHAQQVRPMPTDLTGTELGAPVQALTGSLAFAIARMPTPRHSPAVSLSEEPVLQPDSFTGTLARIFKSVSPESQTGSLADVGSAGAQFILNIFSFFTHKDDTQSEPIMLADTNTPQKAAPSTATTPTVAVTSITPTTQTPPVVSAPKVITLPTPQVQLLAGNYVTQVSLSEQLTTLSNSLRALIYSNTPQTTSIPPYIAAGGNSGASAGATQDGVTVINNITNNTGGTGATTLAALTDVGVSTPAWGDLLEYNGTSWVNVATSSLGFIGTGGVSNLYASTTIGNGTQLGGLTVSGGATTTGNAYFAGSVGIGVINTNSLLNISGSGAAGINQNVGQLRIENTDNVANAFASILFSDREDTGGATGRARIVSGKMISGPDEGGFLAFATRRTSSYNEQLRITNWGRVGIGTTTPYGKLQIQADTAGGPLVPQLVLSYAAAGTDLKHWYASTTVSGSFALGTLNDSLTTLSEKFTILNNGNIGIGTTSPYAKLTVFGGDTSATSKAFEIANSASTSILTVSNAGLLSVGANGSNAFTVDASTGSTTISNLSIGNLNFDLDAGVVALSNIPVDASAAAGVIQSQSINIGDTSVLTVYGESDGAGGVQNLRVGIGTTSPYSTLSVVGNILGSNFTSISNATSTFTGPIKSSCFSTDGNTCLTAAASFYASTTIGNGTAIGGLTISGNATTTGALILSGNRTYSGASSALNSFIWQPGATISGTASTPIDNQISPNHFLIAHDTVDVTTNGGSFLSGLSSKIQPDAGHTGNRQALYGYVQINGAATAGGEEYAGVLGMASTNQNLNGTSGSLSNYNGSLFGGNSNAFTGSGATFLKLITAHEFDVSLVSGSSAGRKAGILIVKGSNDAVRGTYDDAAIQIADQTGASATWTQGLSFGAYSQQWAFGADSTLIGAVARVLPSAGNDIALNGVDFRPVNFSAGGYAFASQGFGVTNLGNVGIGTTSPFAKLSINATSTENYRTLFAIGSTTQSATTTLFSISNTGSIFTTLADGCVQASGGMLSSTGSSCGSGGASFSYPFPSGATTSPLMLLASSTIGNGTLGLTVNGPATTTGVSQLIGRVSINSATSPNTSYGLSVTGGIFSGSGPFSIAASGIASANKGTFTFTDATGNLNYAVAGSGTQNNFTLNNSGNVGVGTTSPWAKFSINNNTNDIGGQPLFVIASSTSNSTTTAFIITNTGNVGVGTTSPTSALYVAGSGQLMILGDGGVSQDAYMAYNTNRAFVGYSQANSALLLQSGSSKSINFQVNSGGFNAGTTAMVITSSGLVGIGTSSPYAVLSVVGSSGIVADKIFATSTTATSTFAGGLNVGSGQLTYDLSSGITSINNLAIGSLNFDTDAGIVNWSDLPIDTNASAGTQESYTANVGGAGVLTVYGESDGSGNPQNLRVGIGTTSPETTLTVVGAICAARGAGTQTSTCGTTAGAIYANSSSLSAGVDVAEMYPTNDASLGAGEIVSFDPQNPVYVERAQGQSNFLGVVSTKPALTLGDTSSTSRAIALAGRVPVVVNLEGGPINVGDAITLSSVPGVGAKATTTAQTVGIALGSWAGGAATGTVDVFIKPELTFIGVDIADLGAVSELASSTVPTSSGIFANIFSRIAGWLADASNGITRLFAKEVDTDKLCVGSTCVTQEQFLAMVNAAGASSTGGAAAGGSGSGQTTSGDTTPPADDTSTSTPPTADESLDATSTPPVSDATSTPPVSDDTILDSVISTSPSQ